ncbi:MAG: hypothetical protein ABIC04_02570 [Nanoarchaeota archaeon]
MLNRQSLQRIGQILLVLSLVICMAQFSYAAPDGPSIEYISNETASPRSASIINTTGGSITTMNLNVTAQNLKWKAFVGNVSGRLMLADATNYSVFDWAVTSVVGEVYASRSSTTVSWNNIGCSNITHITNEERALNHTDNPNDNISTTFATKNHDSFFIGTTEITENGCYSIHTNVNNQTQDTDFEEVILYDGTGISDGDIVFATILEQDTLGFDNGRYDFQMIVPEVALASWTSSTAYYFYAELT